MKKKETQQMLFKSGFCARFINHQISHKIWKDHRDAGRRKDKWDGNGRKREWEEKKEEKEKQRVSFLTKIFKYPLD